MKNKNEKNERICPLCKESGFYLTYYQMHIYTGEIILNEQNEPECFEEFMCSKCGDIVAQSKEDAIKILKGEFEIACEHEFEETEVSMLKNSPDTTIQLLCKHCGINKADIDG
jgi:hypothetical protein